MAFLDSHINPLHHAHLPQSFRSFLYHLPGQLDASLQHGCREEGGFPPGSDSGPWLTASMKMSTTVLHLQGTEPANSHVCLEEDPELQK